jgi:hypothetical protein
MFKRLVTTVPNLAQLKKMNIVLAALYVLQLIAVLIVSKGYSVPITTTYATTDSLQSASSGEQVLVSATHFDFDLNLLWLVVAVLIIGGAVCVLLATALRPRYEAGLKRRQNIWRWLGYAGTTGLLFVALAVLCGMYDLVTLFLVFVLIALSHLTAAWVEMLSTARGKTSAQLRLGHGLIWLAGLASWVVIVKYLYGASAYGDSQLPMPVYVLAVTALLVTGLFAGGLLWQTRHPVTVEKYRLRERNYALLAFVTTTILTWQIVAGALI